MTSGYTRRELLYAGAMPGLSDAPSTSSLTSRYLADSTVFHWQNQSFGPDLIFVLPIALSLAVGFWCGHPAAGMIAAGGATTAGFGAKQSIDKSRLLPMIFASFGMTFSTFLGMLAGHTSLLLVVIAALWGFGYGMLSSRPAGFGWVGQQCVIMLLVASAFPASFQAASARASLIFAGCALQILSSSLLLRIFSQLRENLSALAGYVREEQAALSSTMLDVARSVMERYHWPAALPYALRLTITLGVSTAIYRELHFTSGYWIPMTALLVLKPGVADTANRAIARTMGTVVGAVLASVLIAHLNPSALVLAACTLFFAWLAYGTLNVNYGLFTLFLTCYIVFLLSLAHIPGNVIAYRRALCTVIGGALALAVRLVVLHHQKGKQEIVPGTAL